MIMNMWPDEYTNYFIEGLKWLREFCGIKCTFLIIEKINTLEKGCFSLEMLNGFKQINAKMWITHLQRNILPGSEVLLWTYPYIDQMILSAGFEHQN